MIVFYIAVRAEPFTLQLQSLEWIMNLCHYCIDYSSNYCWINFFIMAWLGDMVSNVFELNDIAFDVNEHMMV